MSAIGAMMDPVDSTSGRMLALLSLLQSRRDWPGGVLADRLDVTVRTVRRDIDRLRELGYRIDATRGPDGGYRLAAGNELPPLLFDDDQAVAIGVALHLLAGGGTGLDDEVGLAAARALTTLRQIMPGRVARRVDAVPVTVVPAPHGPTITVDRDVLLTVSALARAREVLRFDYLHERTEAPRGPARQAEPHHVVTWNGRWYLIAWDLDHDEWRVYRVDRIRPRTPNGPRFVERPAVPGGDVATFLMGRFRGSTASAEWPCRGSVVVDLPVTAVQPYAADGVAEPLGPDRTRVSLGAWSWPALAARFCQFDAPSARSSTNRGCPRPRPLATT